MALSQTTYTGNGATQNYNLTFPYISRDHVYVSIGGVITTAFTWLTASSIQFTVAPTAGAAIIIYRNTPRSAGIVTFLNGARNSAADYNTVALQMLYSLQEIEDAYFLLSDITDDASAAAGSATAAASSASAAAASQVAAAASQAAALVSQLAAQNTNLAISAATGAAGAAMNASKKATTKAAAAATSATNASTSATNAATSATNAASSAAAAAATAATLTDDQIALKSQVFG
jgi:hypothetical protein